MTTDDINRSYAIDGTHIPVIQVKAIIIRPQHHNNTPRIPLTPIMAKHHQHVELAMYFFFVIVTPFLHTKSRNIYFRSVQACNNREKFETISVLKQVNTKYNDRGFTITD